MLSHAKKGKTIKFNLSKSRQVQISVKTNFILPRGITALCNHSLLKKTLKTSENVLLKFLEFAVDGVEILYAAQSHQTLLLTQGLEGVRRRSLEEEAYLQRRLLRQLKRQRFIEERKIGDRLVYKLTSRGRIKLLKRQLLALNRQTAKIKPECVIIFDIPENEKIARDVFRKFLHECGFAKLQQSVWCANAAVLPHLKNFLQELKIQKWVKIMEVKKIY